VLAPRRESVFVEATIFIKEIVIDVEAAVIVCRDASEISRCLSARFFNGCEPTPHVPGGTVSVEFFGVDLAAPVNAIFVLRVFRIDQNFEQFFVTPDSAAVFRRAVSLAGDSAGYVTAGSACSTASTLMVWSQPSPKSYM
jgi:hypothetical protein